MSHSLLHLLSIALIVAVPLFALVWAISVRVRNYGFLDALWTLSIALFIVLHAVLADGDATRRIVFALAGCAWSLRLGIYIVRRVLRHHPEEDRRYRTLRERWHGPGMFLVFFEVQAIFAVVFSLPFALAAIDARPTLAPLEWAGLALALVATAGESLADWQAQRFKHDPANRGAVLDVGLWRYSRHPNYFFESLVWWGFALAALAQPYGWVALVCPLSMLYFLLRVTGIPLTEKHSIESKGEAYRAYQRRTSAFVPWFPRRAS